jgi:predicted NBD/HSP70 family sugar kinase
MEYGVILVQKPIDIFDLMRDTAKIKVYEIIRERGPITRAEIKDITGMKLTTLSRILDELSDKDLIMQIGFDASGGGRRPVLFAIVPSFAYAVGIDISRTYTKAVLFDIAFKPVDSYTMDMNEDCTPQNVVERLVSWLNKTTVDKRKILGIGIGTVGPITTDGIIKHPRDFPAYGWDMVPIKQMMETYTGLPVMVANGADCAVMGEYSCGEAVKRSGVIAYIIIGIGIRCGIMVNGAVVTGLNEEEDAFGHMIVDIDGKLCGCGNYGCLETYCSIPAILMSYASHIKKYRPNDDLPLSHLVFRDFCAALEKGDEIAIRVADDAAAYLSAGLANFARLLNPQLIMLGGPLINDCHRIYDIAVEMAYKRLCGKDGAKPHIFVKGLLSNEAVCTGAAAMIINTTIYHSGTNAVREFRDNTNELSWIKLS